MRKKVIFGIREKFVRWGYVSFVFLFLTFLPFFLAFFNPLTVTPACASEGDEYEDYYDYEIEVTPGGEFEEDDKSETKSCFEALTENRFPFDIFANADDLNPSGNSGCPSFTAWDYTYEYCWVNDVWTLCRPGFVASLVWIALTRL